MRNPAPYWALEDSGWIKSLLLFFDNVAILLPSYMYGRHLDADRTLAEPLEDRGFLQVLEPNDWIDGEVAERLANVVTGLLRGGAFDDLPEATYFHELSQSRIGYGADMKLASSLVEELKSRGLARPSENGVTIPLHPAVRTTILVILGQLARVAGAKRGIAIHPVTSMGDAIEDLMATLSRESMPSRDKLVRFDLEPVTFDLTSIPLDDVLQFRAEHKDEYQAYMRDLRGFMAELSEIESADERETKLLQRRQEIADAAHEIQRTTRRELRKNLRSWSLGIAGGVWSLATGDPVGAALTAAGAILGRSRKGPGTVGAYSYLFSAGREFGMLR